jgi:hypothetical protein
MDNLAFKFSKVVQVVMIVNSICKVPNLNHGDAQSILNEGFCNFCQALQSTTRTNLYLATSASFHVLSSALVTKTLDTM